MRVSLLAAGIGIALLGLAPAVHGADKAVATVGSRTITEKELEKRVKGRLVQIENDRYVTLRAGLDEMIATELVAQEAKKRNLEVEWLMKLEVDAKLVPPTDADVKKFYEENPDKMGGRPLEAMSRNITSYLLDERKEARRVAFLAELRKAAKPTIALKPFLVDVETAGRPEKGGGAKALVTVIMFTDYECEYCKGVEPVIDEVIRAYGDKVRFVVRDLPLDMHPAARLAAEAAACANVQGKYWPYHDKLFASAPALMEIDLRRFAADVKLDIPAFDACLREHRFKSAVDKDIADAAEIGVVGTPVFVVNGRLALGYQSLESFKEIIDEVLASLPPRPGSSARP